MQKLKLLLKKLGLRSFAKKIFKSVNFSHTVKIGKLQIKVPQVYGIRCKVDEPWMFDILTSVLKWRSGAFIDVGVNIGQTLVQVKAVDSERVYMGFEPNPSCVFYVELLTSANNFKNCTVLPVGLYKEDTVKWLDLFGDDLTNSGGTLVKDFRSFRKNNRVYRKIVVPVYTFQTAVKGIDIGNIDIIKIDVEGGELEVLESLAECLTQYKPIILLEVLPVYSIDNNDRLERQTSLEVLLAKHEYRIYRIIKSELGRLNAVKEVKEFGIHNDLNLCDYVLIPIDQVGEVQNHFKIIRESI
jgi:FkbM family methyltransferase